MSTATGTSAAKVVPVLVMRTISYASPSTHEYGTVTVADPSRGIVLPGSASKSQMASFTTTWLSVTGSGRRS